MYELILYSISDSECQIFQISLYLLIILIHYLCNIIQTEQNKILNLERCLILLKGIRHLVFFRYLILAFYD